MKRFLVLLFVLFCIPAIADTAVQQDQNAGPLVPATSSFTIQGGKFLDLLFTAPTNTASWTANNPNGAWCVLPAGTRGLQVNAFNTDFLVGHASTLSTGSIFVGVKIASGSYMKWESINPDQRTFRMRVLPNLAATGTITIVPWGN